MILMITLSGCVTKNCSINSMDLPEIPVAGENVADELANICSPQNKCIYLNKWLNDLYMFKTKYSIYQEKLK